jgi:DNA-directed RNA polymerase specialized sigma24 family protein
VTPASAARAVADCEDYIRAHHAWLTRVATAVGRAYLLPAHMHEELLAELYEALFQSWATELSGVSEHVKNGFAYKVLMRRAERRRAAWLPTGRPEASTEAARAILVDGLSAEERDVIMLMYGLDKDESQVAGELGLAPRKVSRRYESALETLAAGLPTQVGDEADGSRGVA